MMRRLRTGLILSLGVLMYVLGHIDAPRSLNSDGAVESLLAAAAKAQACRASAAHEGER